jgi:hypothetical protein
MAAYQVLLVMLLALGLGALFNADRMVQRAEAKPFGDSWRPYSVAIWKSVRSVSHVTGLNLPRKELDQAIGRKKSSLDNLDVSQIVARQASQSGGGPSHRSHAEASGPTTTTVPDYTPHLRVPTAAKPLRLWVGGDSMSQEFGIAFERDAVATGLFQTNLDSHVSTGLTRPDFFNWPAHLASQVIPGVDPEVMVIMFGANDSQGIQLPDGKVCKRFEQCWLDEYRRRVAATMDLLRDPHNRRVVIWVGQPIMGPRSGVAGMEKLDAIYFEEAAKRKWVHYFDSWPFFTDKNGQYADYLAAADGTQARMRIQDQVHFTAEGADRLAWAVLAAMADDVDMRRSKATPPRSKIAPSYVHERGSLPPPTAGLIE